MHKGQRRDDVMARVPLPENYLWLCIAGSVWLTHWGAAIPVSQQDRLTLTSPYVSRLFLPNLISSTFVLSSCLWSISALCTSDHADSVKATWCLHQLRSGNTCIAPTQCPTSVFSHTTLCLQASVWQTHSKVNLKQIPLWAIIMADAFKCLFAFSCRPTMWNNYYLYHLRGENTDPALSDNVCLHWDWNPAFWHQVQYFFHGITCF